MTTPTSRPSLRRKLIATTALMGGLAGVSPAWGQLSTPNGPTIDPGNGAAAFAHSVNGAGAAALNGDPGTITVTVNENNTIINWSAFDIKAGSTARFDNGVGGQIAVLNRDLSGNSSLIEGALSNPDASISLYLTNPSGVVFGSGANVNVGSLIASTLGLTDLDFRDGDGSLNFTGASGAITVNTGATLTAATGNLVLIGAQVDVQGGTLGAANGNVNFVAATNVTVSDSLSPLGFTIKTGTAVANALSVKANVSGKNITLGYVDTNGAIDAILAAGTFTATDAAATGKGIVLGIPSGSGALDGALTGSSATNVTLSGNLTLEGGAANVSFAGKVDGAVADTQALTVNTTGTTSFAGAIGSAAPLASLTTNAGGTTRLAASVDASGNILFNDAVVLTGSVGVSSTAGSIAFASTVDGVTAGASALSANTLGTTTFGGVVGGDKSLASLATDVGGATNIGADIIAAGTISFDDSVSITGATVGLTSTGGGAISFNETVSGATAGANALTVNTTGATLFNGVVGATALKSLETNAGGTTQLAANVTATGAVTFNDDVVVNGATIAITSTGNDAVSFLAKVDAASAGANAFTVNTGGDTVFGGVVGTTALKSLETNAGGTTKLAADVTATGAITYNDDVVITGAAVTVTSTGNNAVSFLAKIDSATAGANALTVNTTGATVFGGVVGTTALKALTTNAGGTTSLGGNVTVADADPANKGAISFNDDVLLAANVTVESADEGDILFGGTIQSAVADAFKSLTVNTDGTTTFSGAVGNAGNKNLLALTTDAAGVTVVSGGTVSTTGGDQSFGDAVKITGNTAFTALKAAGDTGTANISFATLDGDSAVTPRALTVNSKGAVTFNGAVGSSPSKSLSDIDVDAVGDVKILSTIAAAGKTTVDSTAASILFCGATCSINAGGAVELTAMLNVSGVAAAGGTVSDVIVGSANSGADLAIESGSNLRIGSATAANDLSFKVAGAVSGLPAVTAVTGAGDLTGASIKVRAGETAADIVRLNQVTANGAPAAGFIDIRGGAIAINGATANNGITLAATAGGIYLGSANAGSISLTSTIAPDTTTILNRPDLDPSDGVPPDTIGTSFGFANLTATAGTVKVAALDGASPVGGYAQLGTVQAGTDVSAAATNGMVANKAVATAGAIDLFTQTGLLSLGVSLDGTTALDASTAGTSVRLRKAGIVSELRAGTVTSGTANTGSSDVTILSATDARLANLVATGADLTVRTGVDLAFDPVAPVAEARAGAATGLKAPSTALDGGYGRALLSASAKSAATGGAITVDAGTLIQLGIVTADKRITLDAGTNSTVGDLKFRDGAIDVSQAVSRDTDGLGIDELAQGLTFTAFNDGDPVAQPSGILIGTMQSGGLTAADLAAGLSRSTGAILVTTTGTAGDIAIGAGLTAEGATLATGLIAIDSTRSVLLRGGAFDLVSGTAADPRVRSVVGDVTIAAARDIDGLPADFVTGLALVDDVVIGSGNGSAGLTIKSDGNLRIGSATSTNGAVSLTAAGAVSGLPIPFTAPTTALAGAVEGRVLTVTASADPGRYARLDSIVASQSATVDAHTIAIGTLDACGHGRGTARHDPAAAAHGGTRSAADLRPVRRYDDNGRHECDGNGHERLCAAGCGHGRDGGCSGRHSGLRRDRPGRRTGARDAGLDRSAHQRRPALARRERRRDDSARREQGGHVRSAAQARPGIRAARRQVDERIEGGPERHHGAERHRRPDRIVDRNRRRDRDRGGRRPDLRRTDRHRGASGGRHRPEGRIQRSRRRLWPRSADHQNQRRHRRACRYADPAGRDYGKRIGGAQGGDRQPCRRPEGARRRDRRGERDRRRRAGRDDFQR
jgi:filamentous hemagglutinin family protein